MDSVYKILYTLNMRTASTTEVRRELAELIRVVNVEGQPICVTDYNVPVALLVPVPRHLKQNPKAVADAVMAAIPGVAVAPLPGE